MKLHLLLSCLGVAATLLGGCQTQKTDEQASTFGTCAAGTTTVRTVADEKGTLRFDQQFRQYRIDVVQPGTIDAVDVGVVCGSLPPAAQADGRKVVFSGTYKAYNNPPSVPGGTTFYHLELTKLQPE